MSQSPAAQVRSPAAWRLILLGASVTALAYFGLSVPQEVGGVAPIWLANAPVLASLLRAPRRQWWSWLAVGFAGMVAGGLLHTYRVDITATLAALNMLEATLCALLLRKLVHGHLDPSRPAHQIENAKAAAVAAVVSGVLAAGFLTLVRGDSFFTNLSVWAVADALGLIILAPCVLILMDARRHLRERPITRNGALVLALLIGVNLLVFGQGSYPFLFLVPPALLLVGFTTEVFGAALAVLITSAIAAFFTFQGEGTLTLARGGWTTRLLILQVFLVVTSIVSLQVAALHRRQRRMAEQLAYARQEAEAKADEALEAKAAYRLLADKATDIISRTLISGELAYVSPSVEAVTGFSPEEVVGLEMVTRVHPEDQANFVGAHLELVTGRRTPGEPIRYRILNKHHGWVWVEGNPSVVHDEAGHPTEFVDVTRDISKQVELEARAEAAREETERLAAVKTEFLANMSHEIRTPLTSIIGFATLLEELKLKEPGARYASRVASASRTLLAIVNDILDFSKLEAGRLEIKPKPTDLTPCAQDVVELFAAQAEAKGLALELAIEGEPPPLMVDSDRLRQVLMNLVGNAVKFTEAGAVRVECGYDAAAERVKCRVSDTGPGLDAEAQAKLFQRFSQVDGSTTRSHGGTGLGLAICKGLLDAMGGIIGVESEPGVGSTFWFEVPATVSEQAVEGAGESLDEALLGGLRVLAVDDNAANLEIVRTLLAQLGVELSEATGGAEAVEIAGRAKFDLILMDLRMPGIDGWAAARQIRDGDGPNAKTAILAFSADVTSDRFEAGLFNAVVRKPIEPLDLFQSILRWSPEQAGETEDADAAA